MSNRGQMFYSNCLLETIKTLLKHPFRTKIFKKGSWKILFRKGMFPHFYWKNCKTNKYYDFRRYKSTYPIDTFWNQFWFEGKIEEIKYIGIGMFR